MARCTGAAAAGRAAVDVARDHDLRLSVKGSGHSYAGQSASDGSLMIDLSSMNGVCVDPDAKTALDVVVAYAGDQSTGKEVLQPLREFGDPILDGVRPQPYTALQQTFDDGVAKGHRWYSKGHYLDALPDEAIDTVVEHVDPLPGPFSMVYFEPMGGAIGRVDPTATAFPAP